MELVNINAVGPPVYRMLARSLYWLDAAARPSRTLASISARHVTYRSATAKMAASDMLESSIAFWKEFNSGDLQVRTVVHLVLNHSR